MELHEYKVVVPKTARYYTLNQGSETKKEVVVVLHGYAQLAQFFIKKFQSIVTNTRTVIAPEGLSKFYWNGMNGKVVASWMTKEDRLSEIADQTTFLDKVYEEIQKQYPQARITLLGFSQGAATAVRWVVNTKKAHFNRLILWGGAYPYDALEHINADRLKTIPTTYLIGDNDQYITIKETKKGAIKIEKVLGNNIELITYQGDHNIFEEPLLKVFLI